MSSKNIIENAFSNCFADITVFYSSLNSIPIAIKKLELNVPSLIEILQKQLDSIIYGDLSFQEKLNYQFVQYTIKEIKLWIEFDVDRTIDWYNYKYLIFSWILISLTSQIFKKDSTLKINKTPLLTDFITELAQLPNFFALLNPMLPHFDVISLKIALKLLEHIMNFIKMLEQYNIENFSTENKNKWQEALLNSISVLNEQSNLFLKQIRSNNLLLRGIGKTFSINYFKLHEMEINSESLNTFVTSIENIFQNSIIKSYNSMNLQEPINKVLETILGPKIITIEEFNSQSNLIVQKIHNWLITHNFFSFPLSFPLKTLVIPIELKEWFPEISIKISDISDTRKEVEIWVNYFFQSSKHEKNTLLNEKMIEYWLLSYLLPGDAFYSNSVIRMSSSLRSQINEIRGKKRWQKYMLLLLLEGKYFTDKLMLFSILWLLFIELKKTIYALRFHWDSESQSIENLSKELANILKINVETAYKEIFSEILNPEESFMTWVEALILKRLADLIVPISSLQRLNDFLIRLGNMPTYLIYQAAEQFFHVQIKFPILEDLIGTIDDLLSHINE